MDEFRPTKADIYLPLFGNYLLRLTEEALCLMLDCQTGDLLVSSVFHQGLLKLSPIIACR